MGRADSEFYGNVILQFMGVFPVHGHQNCMIRATRMSKLLANLHIFQIIAYGKNFLLILVGFPRNFIYTFEQLTKILNHKCLFIYK